ncbi:hypothetical protein MADA3029_270058 [Vibrio nigripulchritudo MADA3029]|nr:hypothetical protein VIBNIMADA3020_420058 [Vibrio nigripulchritudo MADA3020]CCN56555.1 hypothetical protein VIBNIMADA3021_970050 [Vibrio nigripulchritudo MADA3021]CCN58821.1 hypothetical protein MADA3029_270058 [Vibrio nigripulchritudo MADA3029]
MNKEVTRPFFLNQKLSLLSLYRIEFKILKIDLLSNFTTFL